MSTRDYAEVVKWVNVILGACLCLTIVLAPMGVAFIRFGIRRSREILEEATTLSDPPVDTLNLGVATSWDDIEMDSEL